MILALTGSTIFDFRFSIFDSTLDIYRYNNYYWSMNARTIPIPLEDHLFVSLLKATDALSQQAEQLLKAAGLTSAQYNVLRILRGAEPDGLLCRGIAERMISHDPDMTRMLDRMEKRGWITRQRQKDDRRVIKTRITPDGLKLLKKLDQPVHDLHKSQFGHMAANRLKQLAELLDELQSRESALPSRASKPHPITWKKQ
jgi:DNA-binding MarR family transcriptional regulator